MCGILGYINKESIVPFKEKFTRALNQMTHRGPDGFGIWEDADAIIGHKRLSIIDLSQTGHQPMIFNDRYILSFNGEIYNYKEIRQELRQLGFQFKGNSDSEVLLYAYSQWKETCLEKLEGMWAFAVWDKVERELFLARDRAGQKPLFYRHYNNFFGFSSEMKGLYPVLDEITYDRDLMRIVLKKPEKKGDNGVFKYEYTDKCLVKGLKRLESGCFLRFKNGEVNVQRYWTLEPGKVTVSKSYKEQVEQFRFLFDQSVKRRMESDVPLATALSGGVDSSAIAATVNKLISSDQNYKVFIAQMKGSVLDEAEYAMQLVHHAGLDYEVLDIDPLKGIENLDHVLYQFEEMYLANPLPMVNTYKAMYDQGYKVSLDGHGADELFGGYESDLYSSLVDQAPNYFKISNSLKQIAALSGEKINSNAVKNYYKHALKNRYLDTSKDTSGIYYEKMEGLDYLNTMLYKNTTTGGLPTLVRNYDRYSMISSVEVRCPFLDRELMEFAFSLPSESKFKNGYSKNIVRDAVADRVPSSVIYRKRKMGFHPPMHQWLQTDLKEWFLDEINSSSLESATLINGRALKNKVNAFYAGELKENAANLWEEYLVFAWEKSLKLAKKKLSD